MQLKGLFSSHSTFSCRPPNLPQASCTRGTAMAAKCLFSTQVFLLRPRPMSPIVYSNNSTWIFQRCSSLDMPTNQSLIPTLQKYFSSSSSSIPYLSKWHYNSPSYLCQTSGNYPSRLPNTFPMPPPANVISIHFLNLSLLHSHCNLLLKTGCSPWQVGFTSTLFAATGALKSVTLIWSDAEAAHPNPLTTGLYVGYIWVIISFPSASSPLSPEWSPT